MSSYTEKATVEEPTVALFAELGYAVAKADTLGRETTAEVVLRPRLEAALGRLNPGVDRDVIGQAVEVIVKDRGALAPAQANREVYRLLKDGVKVEYLDDDGDPTDATLRVIDWNHPEANDFLVVPQLTITGLADKAVPDLVGFVNGIPLLLLEFKKSHGPVRDAFDLNLTRYKRVIPHLFWYNALVILSNGSEAKVGSMTAGYEHFADWKRISDEGEQGIISLETMVRGMCAPARLLDIVENFTLFDESERGVAKIIAKNHQYLGVNNTVAALGQIHQNQGRLGVFWHTQGSGKSYSMVFFAQKVQRKVPGNWSFVVITDRLDLERQIYANFGATGALNVQCQAKNGDHLKQLLRANNRFIFTLIQKFGVPKGETTYPQLSDRADIIVMTDEAHRSQYDDLARYMRNALPNAAFLGFTGTPLMVGEEKTRDTFGDYVSVYNFRQSVEDGATVPLFYDNRIPELQIANENFGDELEALLDAAELDDEQNSKLQREFARAYHLITRDDRLEKVAEDLVAHFLGRGHRGKAMMVCIDKLTAVRMYDKVQKYWQAHLARLKADLATADPVMRETIQADIRFMELTDMAVVVSAADGEKEKFAAKGFDITHHRQRMEKEDLEKRFKQVDDPFRLVFVCAMWLTGFDAKAVSTIYLDKPMRGHTLMQTIARANRVLDGKLNGLIVDYVGVLNDLRQALAIYGSTAGGGIREGDNPIERLGRLVDELRRAVELAEAFCEERGVNLKAIIEAQGFGKVAALDHALRHLTDRQTLDAVDDAVEQVLGTDESKRQFLALVAQVARIYKAVLPSTEANDFAAVKTCLEVIAEKIGTLTAKPDISALMGQVNHLLDESVAATPYLIQPTGAAPLVDLSQLDFDALRAHFEEGRQRTEVEVLRNQVARELDEMVARNPTRQDLVARFRQMVEDYNLNADPGAFFAQIVAFIQNEVTPETRRGVAEQLTEEELTIFDILVNGDVHLADAERSQVKQVARDLLEKLKGAKLVLDWRNRQQTRADVLVTIGDGLNQLPPAYADELRQAKRQTVYDHFFEKYQGEGVSIYQPPPPRPDHPRPNINP